MLIDSYRLVAGLQPCAVFIHSRGASHTVGKGGVVRQLPAGALVDAKFQHQVSEDSSVYAFK